MFTNVDKYSHSLSRQRLQWLFKSPPCSVSLTRCFFQEQEQGQCVQAVWAQDGLCSSWSWSSSSSLSLLMSLAASWTSAVSLCASGHDSAVAREHRRRKLWKLAKGKLTPLTPTSFCWCIICVCIHLLDFFFTVHFFLICLLQSLSFVVLFFLKPHLNYYFLIYLQVSCKKIKFTLIQTTGSYFTVCQTLLCYTVPNLNQWSKMRKFYSLEFLENLASVSLHLTFLSWCSFVFSYIIIIIVYFFFSLDSVHYWFLSLFQFHWCSNFCSLSFIGLYIFWIYFCFRFAPVFSQIQFHRLLWIHSIVLSAAQIQHACI